MFESENIINRSIQHAQENKLLILNYNEHKECFIVKTTFFFC